MRMPDLPFAGSKYKKSVIEWQGLDRRLEIAENCFSETVNLSTKAFPLISPRPPRETAFTLSYGQALFASSQLAWVDGTNFLFNNVVKGTVTASAKSMVELSKRIVIFPDKKSYDTVGDTFSAFGSGVYPVAGSVPDIDYACVLDNRIWGVKGDNIYCTALGDYDNWTTFSSPSEATDAWSVDTGTNGDFTGIAAYKGYNLAFKKDCVWKRYGDIPENFQFVEISKLGCISHKSIKEVNNVLFWLSPQGIVAYSGGTPEVISEELNESYVSAVAGGDDRRYYISLYNGSEYKLYVYDTWKNAWLQEDNLSAKDIICFNGSIYALASDNKIYKFNSGTEHVSWSAVTKTLTEEVDGKKGYSEISLRVSLEAGSSLQVFVKVDNGSFALVKSYSAADLSSFVVPLKISRCDHFAVKFSGSGEGKVYQLARKFYIGSNA